MSRAFMLLAVLAVAGCERKAEPDPRPVVSRALRGVLVYPLSTELSIAAGEDAGQATLLTVDSVPAVAKWFRRALAANGWKLQSDRTGQDGSVNLYAETADKRPLWITLRPNVGAPGTTYTLIGAIVADSGTGTASPPSAPAGASPR